MCVRVLLAASLAVGLFVLTVPAGAQPTADPSTRASMLTNGELMQAWVNARAMLIQAQDKIAADEVTIKDLQAKLENKAAPGAAHTKAPTAAPATAP